MVRKHNIFAAMQPVRMEATFWCGGRLACRNYSTVIRLAVRCGNARGRYQVQYRRYEVVLSLCPRPCPSLARLGHIPKTRGNFVHANTLIVETPLIQHPGRRARPSEKISWSLVTGPRRAMDSWTESWACSPWAPRDPVRFMLMAMGKPRVRFQPHAGRRQL